MGRNVGFELILNSFARFPEEQPALVATLYDKREESVGFYGAIIALVQAGDPEAARQALRDTFTAMDEEWLARHGHRPGGDTATRRQAREAREAKETKETDRKARLAGSASKKKTPRSR